MTYTLELEILYLPPTPNNMFNKHYHARNREINKQKKLVFDHLLFKKKPDKPLTRAALVYTRYSSKESDHDGLVGSFKHIQDALVKAQIIIDDKPSVIGNPTHHWVKTKHKQGKITISLTEVI